MNWNETRCFMVSNRKTYPLLICLFELIRSINDLCYIFDRISHASSNNYDVGCVRTFTAPRWRVLTTLMIPDFSIMRLTFVVFGWNASTNCWMSKTTLHSVLRPQNTAAVRLINRSEDKSTFLIPEVGKGNVSGSEHNLMGLWVFIPPEGRALHPTTGPEVEYFKLTDNSCPAFRALTLSINSPHLKQQIPAYCFYILCFFLSLKNKRK